MTHRPIVIAHRGGAAIAPENTLAAFRRALELGVDGIEFDLQRNAAGELVVLHDILGDGDMAEGAPRLESVLDLVAALRPDARLVVDLKATPWCAGRGDDGRRLVDAAAPLLEAHLNKGCVVLASFDFGALEHAAHRLPAFATAFHTMAARWLEGLSAKQTGIPERRDVLAYHEEWRQRRGPGHEALSPLDLMKQAGGAIWSCQHRDLAASAVAVARGLDLMVWTWTVNTESDLARVLALGSMR